MKTGKYLTVSIFVLFFSTSAAGSTEQKIVFPLSKGDKSISLEFKGEVYDDTTSIKITEQSSNELAAFIGKVISANTSSDKQKILGLWSEKHRKFMDAAMSNPKMLERNAAFFRNMKSSSLMGYIEYGKYIICYVYHDINNGQGETYLKEYPVESTPRGYVLTNDLSDDFFFSQVSYKVGQYIWPR